MLKSCPASPGRVQARSVPARLVQHPPAEVDDQPHLLGQRDELPGLDEPSRRVMPADECLQPGHAAVAQSHDRLEMQLELSRLDCVLQLCAQFEPLEHAFVHLGLEDPIAALAFALADVHRGVGVADQLIGVAESLLGVGFAERDAEARDEPSRSLPTTEIGISNPRTRRSASSSRHRGVGNVLDQDGELVSAEARGRIGRSHGLEQASGDLLQHLVARGVTQAVVDRLEVVEVEEDDRDARVLARSASERVRDPVGEQRAVRQARHGVVERLVRQLLLERGALARVAAVEHDAADVLVVAEVGRDDLELERAAVAMNERAVERLRARAAVAASSAGPVAGARGRCADEQVLELRSGDVGRA